MVCLQEMLGEEQNMISRFTRFPADILTLPAARKSNVDREVAILQLEPIITSEKSCAAS